MAAMVAPLVPVAQVEEDQMGVRPQQEVDLLAVLEEMADKERQVQALGRVQAEVQEVQEH